MGKISSENAILPHINSPDDLRTLSLQDLTRLSAEIRKRIIEVVSQNGGHLASNLGVVELTLVLHRVFHSPVDKIVWDVGHQCYAHKLVTGREKQFDSIRQRDGLSGFPKATESEHDIVNTGHASTSISAALGLLIGQELLKVEGKVVAVIGDGSLTGGLALEALNHAGHKKSELILVVNDNQMSISPNVGAMSSYLSRITATSLYQNIRTKIDVGVKRIPFFGGRIMDLISRIKRGIKAFFFKETLFSDLGFEYIGPLDGHNLQILHSVFHNVRRLKKPVVVHVATKKGRGYQLAEGNPTRYHGVGPFSIVDGKIEHNSALTFTEVFANSLISSAKNNPKVVAITAAMAEGTGLSAFQEQFPERFFDVGIAEPHAVTFAAGLAIGGIKPVVAIYSTFLQRSLDQIIHDVCLPNLPVVLVVDRAGLVGSDGETHQGLYDLAFIRSIENMTILCPASADEVRLMLEYCLELKSPSLIRFPKAPCFPLEGLDAGLVRGRGVYNRYSAEELLIINVGGLMGEVTDAAHRLLSEGIPCDIYNLRFAKPLDLSYLKTIFKNYSTICLVEDGVETGGVGEQLGAWVLESGLDCRFAHMGVKSASSKNGTRAQLLSENGLDGLGLARRIAELAAVKRFYNLHTPENTRSDRS